MMTPEQLQQLVQLPVYSLLVLIIITLWKAYVASNNGRVEDLKQSYEKNLSDLRTRVMLLEDRAGMFVPDAQNTIIKPVSSGFGAKDLKLD
jgi:hypothetical protein